MSPDLVFTTMVAIPMTVPPLSASVLKAPLRASAAPAFRVTVVPVRVAVPADESTMIGFRVEPLRSNRVVDSATTLPPALTRPVRMAGSPGSITKLSSVTLVSSLVRVRPLPWCSMLPWT